MNNVKIAQEVLKIAKEIISGNILGPGIPDGTGPYSGTPECPKYDDFPSEEGEEVYLDVAYGDDNLKVVIEPENGGYEVEVYELVDDIWTVVEEYYYDDYDAAKMKFEEIQRQF